MNLIELLSAAEKASGIAMDLQGRNVFPYLSVVSNNDDPEGKRRIKVVNPANPGLESEWLRRLSSTFKLDEPLPKVGQTVMVFSVDGIDVAGWYLQGLNNTNPPLDKEDPKLDYRFDVEGKYDLNVEQDMTLNGAKNITINTASGNQVIIDETGNISITAAANITVDATTLTIDADVEINGNLALSSSSVDINGSQIASVGAVDGRGDSLITKGW